MKRVALDASHRPSCHPAGAIMGRILNRWFQRVAKVTRPPPFSFAGFSVYAEPRQTYGEGRRRRAEVGLIRTTGPLLSRHLLTVVCTKRYYFSGERWKWQKKQ